MFHKGFNVTSSSDWPPDAVMLFPVKGLPIGAKLRLFVESISNSFLVTTSKAPVTTSVAPVTSSFFVATSVAPVTSSFFVTTSVKHAVAQSSETRSLRSFVASDVDRCWLSTKIPCHQASVQQ